MLTWVSVFPFLNRGHHSKRVDILRGHASRAVFEDIWEG